MRVSGPGGGRRGGAGRKEAAVPPGGGGGEEPAGEGFRFLGWAGREGPLGYKRKGGDRWERRGVRGATRWDDGEELPGGANGCLIGWMKGGDVSGPSGQVIHHCGCPSLLLRRHLTLPPCPPTHVDTQDWMGRHQAALQPEEGQQQGGGAPPPSNSTAAIGSGLGAPPAPGSAPLAGQGWLAAGAAGQQHGDGAVAGAAATAGTIHVGQ